jgi:outer membrane receptor protein involved in Fe transport
MKSPHCPVPSSSRGQLAARARLALLYVTACTAPLPAQTAPRPGATAGSVGTAATEEAVTLSPFEVMAEKDGSYVATTTLAGTRFNTELKDVPASLSVMTADFLRDIGANNLNDAMAYTIGAEQDSPGQNGNNVQGSDLQLNMRGFGNSVVGRNYFESQTSQDNYNMERATFSRGPNSVLFGTGGAGGIADATTKRAQRRKINQFTNRAGGSDDYRFELDLNRPLTDTLAVRLNTLYWTKKGWRDFEHMDRRSAALAVTWRPFMRTSIRLDGEYGKVDELKVQPWPTLDSVTPWITAGRPLSPAIGTAVTGTNAITGTTRYFISNSNEILPLTGSRFTAGARSGAEAGGATVFRDQSLVPFARYVMGPGATTNNDFLNAGLFLEQQLFQNLFIEAAANRQQINRDWVRIMQWNNARIFADPNARRPDGTANPYVGKYYVENPNQPNIDHRAQKWDDFRLTATYRFSLGRWGDHQVAALASRRDSVNQGHVRSEAWANNPAQASLTNAANTIVRRTYVAFDDQGLLPTHFADPFSTPINVNGITTRLYTSSKSNTLSRFESQVATLQSRFFKGRLVTTFGVRRDEQTSWGSTLVRDPVSQEVLGATRNSDSKKIAGDTRTAGAVLHVQPWLSFAANTSSNATPQNFIAFGPDATNRNVPLGNRVGDGIDLSARFTLFGERVRGAVTYFETNEENSQRFKSGNLTSGWDLWLNQAAIALNKPGAFGAAGGEGGYFNGQDTVDIAAHGWETEWVINVNRELRLVLNGSRTANTGTNQWPRVTPVAQALLVEMKASPATPVTGVGNAATLGALATLMENQIRTDHLTEGKPINASRPYNGNVVVNYRFSTGRLKGVALTTGVNLRGRRVIGYHTVTSEPIWDGDYVQVNASVGYTRALTLRGRKVEWNVTLAGTNVLGDRYGLLPIMGDEIGLDRFSFETTPTVFLTNRFSF